MNTNKPEFIMLVGIPACGKSTLTNEYSEKGYKILSSDELRLQIANEHGWSPYDKEILGKLNGMVFEYVRKNAYEALKAGNSVVIDATNLGRKKRKNFVSFVRRVNCVKKCILFIIPKDICIERNAKREGIANVPQNAMKNMLCNFECPNYWEGWDEIVPIINDTLYNFPFEEAINFELDNPHQRHTLCDHMNIAAQYAIDNNYPSYIVKALKYHDTGKLYTKAFENRKGEKTEIAHYLGHENYSAYLYLTEMCCGKSLTNEEFNKILYEANLINCHMRPISVWRDSDSAKKHDKELFGEKFMEDLMLFHKANRFAH